MSWFEDVMEEVREAGLPERIFHGSCDFYLGWEQLAARRRSEAARANRVYPPVQASAACASMALELALKCLITLEGTKPKTDRSGHEFHILFCQLSQASQDKIASLTRLDGKPTTTAGLIDVLTRCEKTFVTWRYVHEHENADFYEGYISAVTRALHRLILEAHPNFWLWPGITGGKAMALLDPKEAKDLVERACTAYFRQETPLLPSVNERSITHRIAMYLEREIRDLDSGALGTDPAEVYVDCEYNRFEQDPKRLSGLERRSRRKTPNDGDLVCPDIIVHRRGRHGPNLIVVEAKRVDADPGEVERDRHKLRCYLAEPLEYRHAFLVLLHTDKAVVEPVTADPGA